MRKQDRASTLQILTSPGALELALGGPLDFSCFEEPGLHDPSLSLTLDPGSSVSSQTVNPGGGGKSGCIVGDPLHLVCGGRRGTGRTRLGWCLEVYQFSISNNS